MGWDVCRKFRRLWGGRECDRELQAQHSQVFCLQGDCPRAQVEDEILPCRIFVEGNGAKQKHTKFMHRVVNISTGNASPNMTAPTEAETQMQTDTDANRQSERDALHLVIMPLPALSSRLKRFHSLCNCFLLTVTGAWNDLHKSCS